MKTIRISFDTLQKELERVLVGLGWPTERARPCAQLFAETDRDGVYSHGLNRFPRFLEYLEKGFVQPDALPLQISQLGALQVWDGQQGPGNLNAWQAMDQALDLSRESGISCVALRNTNHWMRGGTYGWQAAEAGFIGICFTNTTPNMPPWGGLTPTLGNNPLVIALPQPNGQHVVLDMAMSQFSFGKLQVMADAGRQLSVPGGYGDGPDLSRDPAGILDTGRVLPIGFWKGAGLSLMLDLLAGILSGGKSTSDIGKLPAETGVSQVFIAINPKQMPAPQQQALVDQVLAFTKTSQPINPEEKIRYPGESVYHTRQENLRMGIPVNPDIWEFLQKL